MSSISSRGGTLRFLAEMVVLEREMTTLFADLATHVGDVVRRAAKSDNGAEPTIPWTSRESVVREASELVTGLFMGVGRRGVPVPFEVVGKEVVPLSPYMLVLWPRLKHVGSMAIERHRKDLQQTLKRYGDFWEVYERVFLRRMDVIIHEQVSPTPLELAAGGVPYEIAKYDAPHLWVDPGGYRLSDRIWETSEETRKKLDAYLREAIDSGKGASSIVNELGRFLLPGKELPVTNKPYGRTASYNAMRLARTELAAAYNHADYAAAFGNPHVTKYNVLVSNSSHVCAECIAIAEGGPYEKDDTEHIPPFHPHCLCTLSWVVEESMEKLIGRLRAEIETEFPGSIVDDKLNLVGVRLPEIGVSTPLRAPELEGAPLAVGKPITAEVEGRVDRFNYNPATREYIQRTLTESKELLETGEPIGHGAFGAKKVTLPDGSVVITKSDELTPDTVWPRAKLTATVKQEALAYQVDQILGFDLVPPTSIVVDKNRVMHSCQVFVENAQTPIEMFVARGSELELALEKTRAFQDMRILDGLLLNPDRHRENWLIRLGPAGREIAEAKIAAIDHGVSKLLPEMVSEREAGELELLFRDSAGSITEDLKRRLEQLVDADSWFDELTRADRRIPKVTDAEYRFAAERLARRTQKILRWRESWVE